MAELVDALDSGSSEGYFMKVQVLLPAPKKNEAIASFFFYPSRRLGISSRRSREYHQGRRAALVSHHAIACIFLRLDEIQHFVLMICNSYGIDDIHAFGVIISFANRGIKVCAPQLKKREAPNEARKCRFASPFTRTKHQEGDIRLPLGV